MPTILSPSQSLRLDNLLQQVNTEGLDFSIECTNIQSDLPIIDGLGTLSQATATEISFLANPKYTQALQSTEAGAVILKNNATHEYTGVAILCSDPYLLYSRVAQWFEHARTAQDQAVIHASAYIDPHAVIESGVTIGPFAVIEAGAKLTKGAKIGAHAYIGQNCMIGADTIIHPRVTCYANTRIGRRSIVHSGAVLGADGFGFAPDSTTHRGAWSKIPQFGGVLIGDDVEIGANTTIDRGALDDTIIADGVKLDNQIQIGHNTKIGSHTAMAGCTGVAGSAVIGARCTFGGSAMVSGHLTIVDDVHISAASLVISSVTKPGVYTSAFPIVEHKDWEKNVAVMRQLNKLRRRVQALESK